VSSTRHTTTAAISIVVHLRRRRLVVAHPGGDLASRGEGVDPAEALGAHGADVTAEELQHPGLPRSDGDQPAQHDEPDGGGDSDDRRPEGLVALCRDEADGQPADEQRRADQ
jgi:hypothetical protein